MASERLVDGLSITERGLKGRCEDCILGRQTRRPFDDMTDKSLDPLELVSFDLWGPFRVQSVGGKYYFMPIIDAGTSFKWWCTIPVTCDTGHKAVMLVTLPKH